VKADDNIGTILKWIEAADGKAEFPHVNAEFVRHHRQDTDEELLDYVRYCAVELGHIPKKHEVLGFSYIKSRLGPWPRVLESAGLKETKQKKNSFSLICCDKYDNR